LDQITSDSAETLKFSGSSSNANCALRTLRRMLHKAEEWKLIRHVPKIKLMKEHGRSLRLDEEAERTLGCSREDLRHVPRHTEKPQSRQVIEESGAHGKEPPFK
jgi:hypothetical protein